MNIYDKRHSKQKTITFNCVKKWSNTNTRIIQIIAYAL